MTVAVRVLKNKLSLYLRRVRQGQRVVVTDRGRPIAELGPIGARRAGAAERLQRLVEAGELTLGNGRVLRDIEPMAIAGQPLSRTILDDRD